MKTETEKTENLMNGLFKEMNRNRGLLVMYEEIGPAGTFGKIMIKKDIADAEQAIKNNDVIQMLQAYQALKENQ
jgi:hypothetical protein